MLVPPLARLFSCEEGLPQDLLATLRSGLPPSDLRNAVVFGSVARGEERATSDVDLLVEVTDPRAREMLRPSLVKLQGRVHARYGNALSPLVYTTDELKDRTRRRLLRNVETEGLRALEEGPDDKG